ncbi:MAG: heme lyase CcmF/NrfE family subunit, partial [bacterium]
MAELAGFCLLLAFVSCGIGLGVGTYGCVRDRASAYITAQRTLYVQPLLIGIPCGILVTAFVRNWLNFEYVASNSSQDLTLLYKITGLWAGQSGSLLFWAFVLAVYGILVVVQLREQDLDSFYGATITSLLGIQAFFLFMLNWITYPFTRLWKVNGEIIPAVAPPEGAEVFMAQGAGLNPVLQHPGMAIHPPTLYVGYIGLAVPFCFACGALVSGKLDDRWIRQSRIWTMLAWTVLSFGIVLGGWWAYQELGWGGYWAWDPVENASFMPWLMATAFLHSVMVQERRNMLKRWNMILVSLTFVLSIFGTFLTRSGLLDSVHTFAEDPVVGTSFMIFLGVLLAWTIGWTIYRFDDLNSSNELESIFSREFAFLLNNMILVGICFTVLWGTTYPIISEYFTGERVSLGPSFFNQTTIPMFLVLLLMVGVGPLISWRKASLDHMVRNFSLPVIMGVATGGILWGMGFFRWLPILTYSICAFVTTTVVMEFYRGTRARKRSTGEPFLIAMFRLTWKARRRFGGYIVHFAVIIMVIGIATSSAYQAEKEVTLSPGETTQIRGYKLKYTGLECEFLETGRDCMRNVREFKTCGKQRNCRVDARVTVSRSGRRIASLTPGMELLTTTDQPRARV